MKQLADRSRLAGFSLVELLVAMVIGLITIVVIGQVMTVAEGQKRTATTGADAMVNAAQALFTIEREAQGAGYGMVTTLATLGCEVRAKNGAAPTMSFTLMPVMITDGASGAPDSIRFLSSSKNGIALPTRVAVDHPQTAANFFVDSDLGIQVGDLMIAVPAAPSASNWCSVFQVTGTGGSGGGNGGGQGQNQVLHNSGQSDWNQPGGQSIFPSGGYQRDDYLLNLGQLLDHTYDINNANLRLTSYNTATASSSSVDLYSQIVQLQAVYGKDTNNDCLADTWNAIQPANNTEWQQIRALRLALVSRSQLLEKTDVTLGEADVAAGVRCNTASPHPSLVCWRPDPNNASSGVEINLNVGNTNPDWKRYRYRVFDVTVPIRNLVWLQKTSNPACDI